MGARKKKMKAKQTKKLNVIPKDLKYNKKGYLEAREASLKKQVNNQAPN